MRLRGRRQLAIAVLAAVCLLPDSAAAYIGPGAGLSAIGAFLAIVAGVIAALFGFVWYPIKRILRRRKRARDTDAGGGAE